MAGRLPRPPRGAPGARLPARRDARRRQDARRLPGDARRSSRSSSCVRRPRCARSGRMPRIASACTWTRAGATPTAPGAPDVDGVVVTYQQVASAPDLFAHHLARPTFVVLDEVHHAGESATWGTALRAAFDGAEHRLALSGTPFRSDARAIPFVRYDEERRCAPDFVYGYGEAVTDERLPAARLPAAGRDAALARRRAGDDRGVRRRARPDRRRAPPAHRDRPRHAAAAADAARRRRAAGQGARRRSPTPPGWCCATTARTPARPRRCCARSAARSRSWSSATSRRRTPGSSASRTATPRAPRWLVAVNMVSEGVDVPRLILAAYATVKRTDLFFRQAVGRVVRRRAGDPGDLVATVFLPADPTLTGCAERVEVELRQQVSDEVGRGVRRRAAARARAPAGLPAARRPGRARRDDRRRRALRARRGRRRAAAAARARPVRARAALRARVRPPRAGRRSRSAADAGARAPPRRAQAPRARPPRPPLGAAPARDRPRLHLAAGPGTSEPRDGRRRRADAGESQLDAASTSSAPSSPSSRATTRSRPSGSGFPASVEAIDTRLGENAG